LIGVVAVTTVFVRTHADEIRAFFAVKKLLPLALHGKHH
jgi:hypothetical protein